MYKAEFFIFNIRFIARHNTHISTALPRSSALNFSHSRLHHLIPQELLLMVEGKRKGFNLPLSSVVEN